MRILFIIAILAPGLARASIWEETFNGLPNGAITDNGATKWSTVAPSAPGYIFSKQTYPGFEIIAVNNTGDEGVWLSEEIDISSASEVSIEITWGSYWANPSDYLRAYYKVDGGPEILFGEETGKPNLQIASAASAIVSGGKVQIIIRGRENTAGLYGGYPRMMGIDAVKVSELTYLYSRQSGIWNNNSTWSTTGHGGGPCFCTPDANTHVFVNAGDMINLNSTAQAAGVTVRTGGRINYTANALLNIVRGGVLEVESSGVIDRGGSNARVNLSHYTYNVIVNGTVSLNTLTISNANVEFSGTGSIQLTNDLEIVNTVSKSVVNNASGGFQIDDELIFSSTSSDLNFINNGSLTVSDRIVFDNINATVENNGDMSLGAGGIYVNGSDDDGNRVVNSGTLTLGSVNVNHADFVLDNSGAIDQSGNFTNIGNGSSFSNLGGAVWNFSGGGANHRLFASAPDNQFNYTAAGNQPVFAPADAYYHLTLSGSGIKTLAGDLHVDGDLAVEGSARLDVSGSSYSIDLAGDWHGGNSQPFNARAGEVAFNGSADQTLSSASGAETFHNVVVDKPSGNLTLSPSANLAVASLNLVSGGLILNGNELDILSSSAAALSRTNGFIISETPAPSYSRVNWAVGAASGSYVFPFAKSSAPEDYIPFTFTVASPGTGSGVVSAATYGTDAANLPYPAGVTDLNRDGMDISGAVVDRFWQIDLAGYSTNPTATVTFTATPDEVGDNASLRAQRWNSSESRWDAPLAGQTNPNQYTAVVSGVSQFSPWTLADGASPLPVELLYFKAAADGGGVRLEWQTINEKNSDYFTIERTRDLETFEKIGTVESAGDSPGPHTYHFIDRDPLPGVSYYRLRQTDMDGAVDIFEPSSVFSAGAPDRTVVFPNPSDGKSLQLVLADELKDRPLTIRIINAQGRVVFHTRIDGAAHPKFNFERALPAGIYMVSLGPDSSVKLIVR